MPSESGFGVRLELGDREIALFANRESDSFRLEMPNIVGVMRHRAYLTGQFF